MYNMTTHEAIAMINNLAGIADRERKQIKSVEDVGRVRSFFRNSTVIKAFAALSKKYGIDLEVCVDYAHREFLRKGHKDSEQSDAFRSGAEAIVNIFTDCEETIYEEGKKKKDEDEDEEDEDSDGVDKS